MRLALKLNSQQRERLAKAWGGYGRSRGGYGGGYSPRPASTTVGVTRQGNSLLAYTPKDQRFIELARKLGGAWDGTMGAWKIPVVHEDALLSGMENLFGWKPPAGYQKAEVSQEMRDATAMRPPRGEVRVVHDQGKLRVFSPYNEQFVKELRAAAPGGQFNKEHLAGGHWEIDPKHEAQVHSLLQRHYGWQGKTLQSPQMRGLVPKKVTVHSKHGPHEQVYWVSPDASKKEQEEAEAKARGEAEAHVKIRDQKKDEEIAAKQREEEEARRFDEELERRRQERAQNEVKREAALKELQAHAHDTSYPMAVTSASGEVEKVVGTVHTVHGHHVFVGENGKLYAYKNQGSGAHAWVEVEKPHAYVQEVLGNPHDITVRPDEGMEQGRGGYHLDIHNPKAVEAVKKVGLQGGRASEKLFQTTPEEGAGIRSWSSGRETTNATRDLPHAVWTRMAAHAHFTGYGGVDQLAPSTAASLGKKREEAGGLSEEQLTRKKQAEIKGRQAAAKKKQAEVKQAASKMRGLPAVAKLMNLVGDEKKGEKAALQLTAGLLHAGILREAQRGSKQGQIVVDTTKARAMLVNGTLPSDAQLAASIAMTVEAGGASKYPETCPVPPAQTGNSSATFQRAAIKRAAGAVRELLSRHAKGEAPELQALLTGKGDVKAVAQGKQEAVQQVSGKGQQAAVAELMEAQENAKWKAPRLFTMEGFSQPGAAKKAALHPYQVKGVNWAITAKRGIQGYGTGLGKCVLPETRLFVNGELQTAEGLWQRFAGAAVCDGEGEWAKPKAALQVNALEGETGQRIVTAPVSALYRQWVSETVRVLRLADGSDLKLTQAHKLLTEQGWSNTYGPYGGGALVAVPRRLVWQGEPADPDLVTLLAWQIAEGHEPDRARDYSACIAQKDTGVLLRLRGCAERIGQRYGLAMNGMAIRESKGGRCSYLTISSKEYRGFLKGKGFAWGTRSKDREIPSFLMRADQESIRLFLREFFSAEGGACKGMRTISVCSASRTLMQQVAVLLRRFGIWMRIMRKMKCATNGSGIKRPYYEGLISGEALRLFVSQVGFSDEAKQAKAEAIAAPKSNSNLEVLPTAPLLNEIAETSNLPDDRLGFGKQYTHGKQMTRWGARAVGECLDRILAGGGEPEEGRFFHQPTRTAYATLDRERLQAQRERLREMIEQEVQFVPIVSVEEQHYEGWVYDFEVAEHHNFVAEGVLCHNTLCMTATALKLNEMGKTKQGVILIPVSVLLGFQEEVLKAAPKAKVCTITSNEIHSWNGKQMTVVKVTPETRAALIKKYAKGADIVLTGSSALTQDAFQDYLASRQDLSIQLDEAHRVKKRGGAVYGGLQKAIKGREYAIGYTATPVPNYEEDFYTLVDLWRPGALGTRAQFLAATAGSRETAGKKRVETIIDAGKSGQKAHVTDLVQLHESSKPYVFQKTTADADVSIYVPPHQSLEPWVDQPENWGDWSHWAELHALRRASVHDDPEKKLNAFRAVYGKMMHEIAISPALVMEHIRPALPEEDASIEPKHALSGVKEQVRDLEKNDLKNVSHYDGPEPKIDRTVDTVMTTLGDGSAPKKTIVVVSDYRKALDRIAHRLQQEGVPKDAMAVYGGGVNVNERKRIQDAANNGEVRVLLLQTMAGGVGLNLQGKAGNIGPKQMVLVNEPWTPADVEQVTKRISRQGQKDPTECWTLRQRGSIDERVQDLVAGKYVVSEAIKSGAKAAEGIAEKLGTLSLKDYLTLLNVSSGTQETLKGWEKDANEAKDKLAQALNTHRTRRVKKALADQLRGALLRRALRGGQR